MRTKTLLLTLFLALSFASAKSQGVGINSTNASPDPSAGLDVNFTNKGQLAPRLTTSQRDSIANPAIGLFIFNISTNCFNMYIGHWRQWCGDCDFNSPVITNNGPLCPGGNLLFTASTIPGGSYSWTGPNGFTSAQQNPTITNITSSDAGLYSLQVTLNGCTSTAVNTFVTVNNLPATPTAGSNSPVCPGAVINLSATTVSGAFYTWIGPNGFSSTQQNPTVTNANVSDTGTFTVYVTVNGCQSATSSTTVILNPGIPATPGTITGSNTVCYNTTGVSYSVNPVLNATSYNWTVPSGSTVASGQGTPAITVNFGSVSGNVSVSADNSCGASATSDLAVSVNANPPSASFTPTSIPANAPTVFTPATSGAGSYSWTFASGSPDTSTSQYPTVTWASSGNYNVTLTVTQAGCTQSNTVSITITLPAGCALASDNTVWCIAQASSEMASTVCGYSNGYSGTYYAITSAGATALGKTITGYGDCATNYLLSGNSSQIQGTTLSCYTNTQRWARTADISCPGCLPVVRCTSYE